MPNTYKNKVVYNGTTLIDLTADTAIASDVAAGKYFHLATGERVAGTSEGGEGSDLIITLSQSGGMWVPDCTFAEYAAAHTAGKRIVLTADGDASAYLQEAEEMYLGYGVTNESYDAATDTVSMVRDWFYFTDTGVTQNGTSTAYLTDDATIVASDVASGKVAYGAAGKVVGTASGGGGGTDDTDFANTIMRSGAITRIPDSVTSIGGHAFRGCTNLALTELPSGVTSIGTYAFYGCPSLALTELPSGVTSIGDYAFYGCNNLALTELPSGVTNIGSYAFRDCTNLALTELPSGVTSISNYTFYNCTNLALTELPSGVTNISTYAFYGCTNLALTELPSGVTEIKSNVFRGCRGLQQLDAQNVGAINSNALIGCNNLTELVLRKSDAACTLSNVNAFTNTPMRGYNGTSGTVYVPQALIETYKAATNWSTLYNAGYLTFAAIEGSEYERD